VVTSKHSGIFLNDMIRRGFCPRIRLNGVPADAPYLTSRVWNDIAFCGLAMKAVVDVRD
jgi:hypothetical protein